MMYWHGNGVMSGWGWGLTTISMILFLGLLVAAGIALYRHFNRGTQPRIAPAATAPQTPEQILAERYARGEIDENEYTTRLATVRDHDRHSVRP